MAAPTPPPLLPTPTTDSQGYYVAPTYTNPYADQIAQNGQAWSGDQGNAWAGVNQANLNMVGLQNQQQSVLGDGGFGFTAGGGNDTSGSDYGRQVFGASPSQYNPWSGPSNMGVAPGAMTPQAPTGTNSSYPTYTNSMGIGTGGGQSGMSSGVMSGMSSPAQSNAPTPQMAPTPNPTSNAQQNSMDSSSPLSDATRGFNPWSLTGEANARVM
jgi:hypothetical protein